MAKQPQRTVEAAIIEGIGPVTASHLLSVDENRWGIWRDRITDRRFGKDGLTARCMLCNGAVYIKTAKLSGVSLPLFAHYSDSDSNCPWYQGRNITPDDARASQYQGHQESEFHWLMCNHIAELVALDERYVRHTVAEYLPPSENEYGRFPDVFVEWAKFGSFAVEFQMSGTFQTEISARCKHYEYEGIPLLWILFGIDMARPVQQSFLDVIRRHRGNAFVLDPEAIAESRKQKTLVLTCYLYRGDWFESPKLVRFDELFFPRSKLPYHEDCIVPPLLAEIKQRRNPWFKALDAWDRDAPLHGLEYRQGLLVAAAFSIVANANGNCRNYASKHPNIRAMLNTYLSKGKFARYTNLLTHLIQNTAEVSLLHTTVGDHLRRYSDQDQADEQSPEWQFLRELLPEALDLEVHDQLEYLDALPAWAKP